MQVSMKKKATGKSKRENLQKRRQQAVKEILESGGVESVIKFAESVESPERVGRALGIIANGAIDSVLSP